MKKTFLAGIPLIFTSLLCAGARPDFTGTWKLDELRSRADKLPVKVVELKIEQHEPAIRITLIKDAHKGGASEVLALVTDGTEHPQDIDGQPATVTAHWDQFTGDHLVLELRQKSGGQDVVTTRRLKLGDKGKILTTVCTIQKDSAETKAYEFFVKQ